MSIKILTKNSIDNTNIDGARANHFSAGMRSGIVKGAYNEGNLFTPANNKIALDSCELRISGHQVVIDSVETIELQNAPSQPTKMSVIAEIQVNDNSVPAFRLFVQNESVKLIHDNLFKTNNGKGTYQLRIGNFTLGTTGLISDVVRTADIITGGADGGVADIKFNATATQLSSSSQPEVNADYNEETKEWDLNFGIPAGGGSRVTIGGVEQPTWSADFSESERQKSKNLLVYPYFTSYVNAFGITYTDNGDGSFTINGQQSSTQWHSVIYLYMRSGTPFKLKAGTYTIGLFGDVADTGATLVAYDGSLYHQAQVNKPVTFTLKEEATIEMYIQVSKTNTVNFDNFIVYPMLVKGMEVGEWQPYNGAIVHEKDIQRHILTGKLSASFEPPDYANFHIVPLVQDTKVGNKLTINGDGGIVIGAGVSKILVSVSTNIYVSEIGYSYLRIHKNNVNLLEKYIQTKDNGYQAKTLDITPCLFSVSEGDIITLQYKTSGLSSLLYTGRNTYMTVEVVE